MKRKNLLGGALLTCGAVSLVFGWPWGSLVGAILALAGVLALRLAPGESSPPPQAGVASQSSPQSANDAAEQLMAQIKEKESRGEPVPEELIHRAQSAVETGYEDWFQKYEALISNSSNKVVDFVQVAQNLRAQNGWPSAGSILGHEGASEEVDFVLARIEHFGGKVPLREAIFMQAMLEDGPEARYLKERQKRGYPSLFENVPRLQWGASPGFYERQLKVYHKNAFFSAQKQCVSLHDLYIARCLDSEERTKFLERWKQCLEKIMNGANILPASEVTNLLQDLYELLENAASIGAENTERAVEIRSAYDMLLSVMYAGMKDNEEATKALKAAEQVRWSGSGFTLSPQVNQILRIQDKADIIPTMLSLDLEAIRAMVETLGASEMEQVQRTVIEIIEKNPGAREILSSQPEKLGAIGLELADLKR
jgi:hypothetical protein